MGAVGSSLPLTRYFHPESLASVSPWQTSVTIDNQTDGAVMVHLATSSEHPNPAEAVTHSLPANAESGVTSGWYHEPRATLLVRTGLEEAKLLRVPTGTRVIVRLRAQGKGLDLEVPAAVEMTAFEPAASVPGLDTVAMCFRGISFDDATMPKDVTSTDATTAHDQENVDVNIQASIVGAQTGDV